MGATTDISWAHSTFNPWIGCTKVSPACAHCYAERDTKRWGKDLWGASAPRQVTSHENWKKPLRWDREAQAAGERRRVFCASLADVFEDRRDLDEPRARLWKLIEKTPHLDWLLLTKRPELMRTLSPLEWLGSWPDNVWAGTTVENQECAEKRVPALLRVPARVRFLSCEPLLGPLDLRDWLWRGPLPFTNKTGYLHWVITGGESGAGFRAIDWRWARDLLEQCKAAGVPFFYKQDSGLHPNKEPLIDGVLYRELPQ